METKTAKEFLKEKGIDDKLEIDTSKPFPKGLRYLTSEAMQAYADQQCKAEREKALQKVMESALAFTQYSQTVPISISELKEILLKLKQP